MPTTVTKRQPHDPWQCMAQMPKPIQLRCWDQARINYDGADTKGKKKLTPEEEKALREKTKPSCPEHARVVVEQEVGGPHGGYARMTLCRPHAIMLLGTARVLAALGEPSHVEELPLKETPRA